jgi:hypothetical protein
MILCWGGAVLQTTFPNVHTEVGLEVLTPVVMNKTTLHIRIDVSRVLLSYSTQFL